MTSEHCYFMSHILPVYKRALVWDDNLCWIVQALYGSVYSYSAAFNAGKHYLVGSCSDVGSSPRMYRSPPVLEGDMLILSDGSGKNYGQPHPDKVGVYVKKGYSRQSAWDRMVTQTPYLVESPAPDSPMHIHDLHQKVQEMINSKPGYYPKWYKKHNLKQSNKGPSHKSNFIEFNTSIHIDDVHAHHHQGWPQEAEEWKTRARLWPPESVVKKVLQQGYQVVEKLSSSTGDIDGPMEYHITFALCERYLARQRTPVQKLVYLMAKTVFYTYLDIHDDEKPFIDFPSYALKTCMMWLMEQTPVDRWTEDNVQYLLRELLTRLSSCVESGSLKNYFMIGANVLSNCTSGLREKIGKQLALVLSDMDHFLQDTTLYKCNILLYGYYTYTKGSEAYDQVVYECEDDVLTYGLRLAMENVFMARAAYKSIISILVRGTGEGLKAEGYLYDEEECFHILKTMMNVYTTAFYSPTRLEDVQRDVPRLLHRHPVGIHDLIKHVLCLDPDFVRHLPKSEVTIIRLHVQWQDERLICVKPTTGRGVSIKEVDDLLRHDGYWKKEMLTAITYFPGETDVFVVRKGCNIHVYPWSKIGELIELIVRDLWNEEALKWMPKIYLLTHTEIPELHIMDFARMLYLLYVCDDKRAQD